MSEEVTEIVDQLEDMEITDLREVVKAIREIIDGRETPTDVQIGDGVEFELRDGFTVGGTVTDLTNKRAKVKVNAASGQYTIDLKRVKITYSAPTEEVQNESTESIVEVVEAEVDPQNRNTPEEYLI